MDQDKQRVLVLCTGNSCRSQMAEGWINALYGDRAEAVSAGSQPSGIVHPQAVAAMAEVGIDIGGGRSKHLNEFLDQPFDLVLTVCDSAAEHCPVFPGPARRVHRGFYDPARATGDEDEIQSAFRRVRDEIRDWLDALLAI